MFAVRNIRLCTKDCLCLYVCPTGATDTETGQIDASKCIGCGLCAGACPSGAISMVPEKYPPQQKKAENMATHLKRLAAGKVQQEAAARALARIEDPELRLFAQALEKSNRLMAEDLYREAGYMLPQSTNTHKLLTSMVSGSRPQDFPKEAVKRLLKLLKTND
ncbi:4Fe-4S binding protein [Clostridium sp. AM58-1XD]|uniref:4Fe-4S binding protein n=1 Tax=Clostridium sp. AM58-1XD TaxID=2292307 RepID=UPI000E4F85CC|nr:4Fe-4S binding protein [Clostridium sp. AM58-1XD]RGZ01788.1 4Fe-4S dicluster domain-containing protein [Clostridium sp. AM58-1XD]